MRDAAEKTRKAADLCRDDGNDCIGVGICRVNVDGVKMAVKLRASLFKGLPSA